MEPRKRTHLVNELMQEAHLMMGVLEKAMQGERLEESHPTLHGAHHPQGQYKQHLQSMRRNVLPMERINRSLLMLPEHLTRALV